MSDQLVQLTAAKLAELIRTRAVSPVEVIEAHLARIEQVNPHLNAIVTLAPDALERAREAEAALLRGETYGALDGVPVTIKDTIETKGLRTTSGALMRARHVSVKDAPAVARLRAAGAIILGKTNVSEIALAYEADNPVFGRTNNPYDFTRTPGGSSGGCAAAVSACLAPAGLGSDLAGSIRIPAHFCGIVGLKPTAGSLPGACHFPPQIGPFALGASLGPLARRVEDLALLFNVLAGFDSTGDSLTHRGKKTELRGQRVAWFTDDTVVPVTEETRRAVKAAGLALGEAGFVSIEERPPCVERGPALWRQLFSPLVQKMVREAYTGHEAQAGPIARALLSMASGASPHEPPLFDQFIDAWMERDRLRSILIEWMNATPLIVAPVGAVPAFEHGARKVTIGDQQVSVFRAFGYAQTYNVFDLPAVSVPAGYTREGLPIGVQIVGRPFEEELVLKAARIVEEALGGWHQPPPAVTSISSG